MTNHLFIFGYGYVADALVRTLRASGEDWQISATTRDIEKMRALRADGLKMTLFDRDLPLADPAFLLQDVTHILLSIPPYDDGDITFLSHADDIIACMPQLKWIGLLSSTAVYGDRDGGVCDETAERRPTNRRGSRRALAESQWQAKFANDRLPLHIFRLAGIYGPGRSAIDAVRVGNSRRIYKPGHAFSRIHVDDVVQVLRASMAHPTAGEAFNVADDNPSPSHELIKLACEMLDQPVPPLLMFDEIDMAPMARSFYLDNKRIDNTKIKEKLGITLKYPSFTQGLPACLEAERTGNMPHPFFTGSNDNAA